MAGDEDVAEHLRRFEAVEWLYDGLGGRIIAWTKEHGGHSDDPSAQAFVLGADGTVHARAPDREVHQPGSFARWLDEQATAYERTHPRTRVPFVRCDAVVEEDGETRTARCPDAEAALEEGRPVLLYFGRDERPDQSRRERSEVRSARKLERTTLDSKRAAEAAEGWVLLRLDLGEEDHAAYAAMLGVQRAPALVVLLPEAREPEVLARNVTGSSLAYRLKKDAPDAEDG